jgi:hypothetical protein
MLSAEAAFTIGPVALLVAVGVSESVSVAMESAVSSIVSEASRLPPQENVDMPKHNRINAVKKCFFMAKYFLVHKNTKKMLNGRKKKRARLKINFALIQ